jgi:hypothetical protein
MDALARGRGVALIVSGGAIEAIGVLGRARHGEPCVYSRTSEWFDLIVSAKYRPDDGESL